MIKKAKKQSNIPIHELEAISLCLAVVGGFLDAYTYLFRGGVFANAQTGNMVLLGISLSKGMFIQAGYYLIPIVSFFLGILVTEYFKRRLSGSRLVELQHASLIIELLLLLIIAFLPKSVPNAVVNVTVSFVCSMQVNSFRKINGLPYASTMCTGNLRSATEQLSLYFFEGQRDGLKKSLRYFLVILTFCFGAFLGAVLTGLLQGRSVLICCLLLFAVLCIMIWDKKDLALASKP